MNQKVGILSLYHVVCILWLASAPDLRAEMIFYYDQSGNPTNIFSNSSTAFGSSAVNSTQTLLAGSELSLDVEATGSGPFTYQWQLNGANITGATSATYFLASVGTANAGTYSVVVSSSLGSVTNQLGTISVLATANTLYGIAYGLSQYIAVGQNGIIVNSSNLVSWSVLAPGTTNRLNGVTFGTNTFVAVGMAGTILTSSNGSNWTSRSSGYVNDLYGVTYGNGLFVAAGSGGITLTSPDGVAWTKQTFDFPTLTAITFGGNIFVAVGTAGTIWNSPNGTNWTGCSSPVSMTLNSVAYAGGIFVTGGTNESLLSSADGTNWTSQSTGDTETFNTIIYYSNAFYALGPIGQDFISSDGVNWGGVNTSVFEPLFGSVVGNNIPVAVGANGTIVQVIHGVVDHFAWSDISSPQRVNQSFSVTITAQDAADHAVTGFNGSASLSAATGQSWVTNTVLGTTGTISFLTTGPTTYGYAFTPDVDLLVTQVRSFDEAQSVSIWTEDGALQAIINVSGIPNTWVSTSVPVPLTLSGGTTYVIGAYSTNGIYYEQNGSSYFNDGTIDQALYGDTNDLPQVPFTSFWPAVDLVYAAEDGSSNAVSPGSVTFINGVATANVSVVDAGQGVALTANDGQGHSGTSNPFNVYGTNDLALTVSASPSPATQFSNLTYTITVMNAGPSTATSVNMTNQLPSNVTFVSASSSQGACVFTSGQVTCAIGSLANQASATINVIVNPTIAGIVLTNTASAYGSGTDPNPADNIASTTTYVPPTLTISDSVAGEGGLGIFTNYLLVTLSSPSDLAVSFNFNTSDGTNSSPALAGEDYVASSTTYYLTPGSTSAFLPVQIQNNNFIQPTKQFLAQLSNPINATLARAQATVTITNNNGAAGQLYQLAWGYIPSPEVINQPFAVTLTNQDASGNTVSNIAEAVTVTGINIGGPSTTNLLRNATAQYGASNGIYTVGYAFSPTNDIYVTHVRSYSGNKVSIWTDTGFLVSSQTVSSVVGTWVETPLPQPVHLYAGWNYVLGVLTTNYYWRTDGSNTFANGQITQGYSSLGDTFPTGVDPAQWYLVDLRYVLPASITITSTSGFTNGVWAGSLKVNEIGTNIVLLADDGIGHVGFANSFSVYQSNDMSLTLTASPATPVVESNLTYTITVMNPGPNTSTGVMLTNTLPAGAAFVSASSSQGACTITNGLVICNLGTIGNLTSATVSIVITPLVAGLPLTNSAVVTRNESDPNLSNNSAVSILTPNLALSLLLANATDYSGAAWRTGGDQLWQVETNITHGGSNAAQSGPITDSQQSWIETTVRGPGTLSFWWKVSSQAGGDLLWFYTNGVAVTNISGSVDWEQETYSLSPGLITLRWDYIKDPSISSGTDAGWLTQVSYSIPSFNVGSPGINTNGNFFFTVSGTNGQQLILQSSTNLLQWNSISTNVVSGGVINYTDLSSTNVPYQFYRAIFINQ